MLESVSGYDAPHQYSQKKETLSRLSQSSRRNGTSVEPRRKGNALSRAWQLAAKRLVDIVVSLFALIALAPFFIIIAVAISLESTGSPIFIQKRWGRGGRQIRIFKFRSMYSELCDTSGIAQATPDDPRLTPLGSLLRRSCIDELPQLFNVLLGDMSLVGPRCHPIGMRAAGRPYEEFCPAYHRRHQMRPGLTGFAQIKGLRGPTAEARTAKARIVCDLCYVRNFSLLLDLEILVLTPAEIIRGCFAGQETRALKVELQP